MVNQPRALFAAKAMYCLFQSIKNELGMRQAADAPANDFASRGINDKGDIGEIRHRQHVRCWNKELAVHLVQWTRRLLVSDRRPMRLAPDNILDTHALHQSGDCAAGGIEVLAAQLVPDLAHAVDAPVLF